jgi:hypothetical protein
MDHKTFNAALDMFPNIKSIELGIGEPTLHPLFHEFVNAIHTRGIKLGMGTNGTNLKPSCTWRKFSWISIGITHYIDSGDVKSFKWLECRPSFIMVLHKNTPKNWKARLANFIGVNPGINYTVRLDMYADEETSKRFKKEYKESLYYQDRIKPYTGMCYMHCLKPMVYHTGEIYPCCSGLNHSYNLKYPIGNVHGYLTGIPIEVACDECTKTEEMELIHKFLNDKDREFI